MVLKVLIVNYKSVQYLTDCLRSLSSVKSCSITIVDNASGGEEVEQIRRLVAERSNILLVPSPQNLGFGAGVNLAARSAQIHPTDHVWVLNPDTIVDADAAVLLESALVSGKAEIVSPLILSGPRDNQKIWFAGGGLDMRTGRSYHSLFGRPVLEAPESESYSDFLTGAAPMFRGDTWEQLGGFREDLFLYWEDADLSIRARSIGVRMMLVPQARIWHKEGGSGGHGYGLSASYYYYVQRNRLIVCGGAQRLRTAIVAGFPETIRLLLKPLLRERRQKWGKFRSSLAGVVAGIRGETGRAASIR